MANQTTIIICRSNNEDIFTGRSLDIYLIHILIEILSLAVFITKILLYYRSTTGTILHH